MKVSSITVYELQPEYWRIGIFVTYTSKPGESISGPEHNLGMTISPGVQGKDLGRMRKSDL